MAAKDYKIEGFLSKSIGQSSPYFNWIKFDNVRGVSPAKLGDLVAKGKPHGPILRWIHVSSPRFLAYPRGYLPFDAASFMNQSVHVLV